MSLSRGRTATLVFAACLMHACGGGGGSDGGGGPPPPPPPPPPPTELVQLVASEVPDYAGASFYSAEDATFAMYVVTRAAQDLNENHLDTYELACTDSGTVSLTADDANRNAALDFGDRIAVTYNDCNDRVAGSYSLDITAAAFDSFQVAALEGDLSFDITFLNSNPAAALSGGGNFSFTADDASLTWLGTSFDVIFESGVDHESFLDGRVQKIFNEDASNSFAFSATIDSDWFGGRVLVETDPRFRGVEGQWPTSGELVVTGRDDGTVRVRPGFQPENALFEIDADGDGILDDLAQNIAWADISSGYSFGVDGETDVPPPDTGPDVLGRRIALDGEAKDMAVNASRGQVYVTIPSQDELVVFSATTLEVVRRVDLASRPAGVSVSADGSEIFVGLAGAGAIAILDADTFAESRIFVGAELGTSETYQVVETAPGILYVSTGLDLADGRVARVDRGTGVITPISTTGFAEIELLADPAHRALFVGDGLQAQAPTVRKVDARNAASPLLLSSTQEPIDPTYRMSLDPAGARLYLAGGLVLATRDFSRVGRISAGIPAASGSGTEVLVASGERDLHVHSTATLGEIDTLETDCWQSPQLGKNFIAARRLLPSPVNGQWLILGEQVLCAVDLLNPETPPGTGEPGVPPEPLPVVTVQSRSVRWGNTISDAAYDDVRKRLYVTLFSTQELVTVDAENAVILTREPLGHVARGVALSPDGSTLAMMFNDDGHIAFKDLATGTITTRNLTALLGSSAGYDVAWLDNDILYASADPPCCDEPFVAYLARVSRSDPAADRRSAGGASDLWKAELAITPDGESLFLNRSSSEARKLDLTQPGEPIVDATRPGPGGFTHPRISPDGTLIAYDNGRILRTNDLAQVGEIHAGKSVFSPDGATLYGGFSSFIDRFDAGTFAPIDRLQAEDNCQTPWQMLATADGEEVISASQTSACFFRVNAPVPMAARQAVSHAPYRCGAACLMRNFKKRSPMDVRSTPALRRPEA